jgi:hypothetical protein
MSEIDDLEKKYGLGHPAAKPKSEIDALEEKYGLAKPQPIPATYSPAPPSARDIALSTPPDEVGIESVPPALQAGAVGAEAAGAGAAQPISTEGPKRDPSADYLTPSDRAMMAIRGDHSGADYLAQHERLQSIANAPDDQVLFQAPRGPVNAGELRALQTAVDTGRQVAAGMAAGGPVAELVGGKLVGAAMGPLQKAAATAGAGAVASTAVHDVTDPTTPLEEIPGHLVESGVAGLTLGASMAAPGEVISRAARGAGGRIDERTFRDIGTGAKPDTQAGLLDAKPDVIAEAKRLGVDPRKAAELRTAAKPAADAARTELEGAFAAAEKPTLAQPLYDDLVAVRDRYLANEATVEKGEKLSKFLDKFASRRLPEKPPQDLVEPPEPRHLTDREVVAELAEGGPKAARAEAAKKIDDMAAVVNKFGLRQHQGDPQAMQAAQNAALEQTGKAIGKVDQVVTEATGGLPIPNVMRAIDKVAQKYSGPGTGGVADKVKALVEEVRADWKDKFPVINQTTRIPLPEVRRLSSRLGETAFTGDPSMSPNLAARVRKDLYGAVRDELNGHINEALEKSFTSSTYPGLRAEVGDFAQLNRDYSALKTLQKLTGKAAIDAALAPAALPTTATARVSPPAVPKSGQVPLSALRSMETALPEGSPERKIITDAIASRVAEASPEVGAKISKLTASQRALELINEAADTRAVKDAFKNGSTLSTGLKDSGDQGLTWLGLGKTTLNKVRDPIARGRDAALMKLALAVNAGTVTPAAIEAAVAAGVPQDIANDLVRRRQSPVLPDR